MWKYSFVTDRQDFESVLRQHYEGLDVKIGNRGEIMPGYYDGYVMTTRSDQLRELISRNKTVFYKYRIMNPVFTPEWTHIKNCGPMTENRLAVQYQCTNNKGGVPFKHLVYLRDGTIAELPISAVLALNSYAVYSKDVDYKKNFKADFLKYYNVDVDKINFVPDVKNTRYYEYVNIPRRPLGARGDYVVTVDGVQCTATNPETPITRIDQTTGHIKLGVGVDKIVLNSPQNNIYKTKLMQGSCWAAVWKTETGHFGASIIQFVDDNDDGEEEEIEFQEESSESSFSSVEDISAFETSPGQFYGHMPTVITASPPKIRLSIIEDPAFETYSAEELTNLPMSYILSVPDQWLAVQRALENDFIDLPKVSDSILDLIADIIAYAISKNIRQSDTAMYVLEYADKRRPVS